MWNKNEVAGAKPESASKTESSRSSAPELRKETALIGSSVFIKGQLSGSEDLYIDGQIEGSVDLNGHNLVVGPNANIRAQLQAKGVVIQGKVSGNVRGAERVELKRSAVVVGDIYTQRFAVEEGAYFKGSVDVNRETAPVSKEAARPNSSAFSASAATASALSSVKPSSPSSPQTSVSNLKK